VEYAPEDIVGEPIGELEVVEIPRIEDEEESFPDEEDKGAGEGELGEESEEDEVGEEVTSEDIDSE